MTWDGVVRRKSQPRGQIYEILEYRSLANAGREMKLL